MKRLVKGWGNLRVRHISLPQSLRLLSAVSVFSPSSSPPRPFLFREKINEDIVYDNLESLQLAVQDNISSSLSAIDKTAKYYFRQQRTPILKRRRESCGNGQ